MKLYLTIVLLLTFVSLSFGQTLSVSPTPTQSDSPERSKAKTFGSSLEKYKNKDQRNFQNNQKNDEADDSETIRIKTDLVVNDILITDQNGKIITNLKKDDFIVTENGVPQKVKAFSADKNASLTRSIVLIISCYTAQFPYLRKSIEAAKLLVDKLNPNDKMAIVTDDVKLLVDFTTDKILLKKKLDSLEIKDVNLVMDITRDKALVKKKINSLEKKGVKFGSGFEFDALLSVLNEMFNVEDTQKIIIFQGDGSEAVWLKTDNDTPYRVSNSTREEAMRYGAKLSNFGFSDVKKAIEKSQVVIYSIISGIRFLGLSKKEQLARAKISITNLYKTVGLREEYLPIIIEEFQGAEAERQMAGQTAMFKVAELSGGFTDFIEKQEDAEDVYSSIFKQISNRYVIGYYPMNEVKDGKLREVKIEVWNHPEYIVTGRKVYLPK